MANIFVLEIVCYCFFSPLYFPECPIINKPTTSLFNCHSRGVIILRGDRNINAHSSQASNINE